MPSNDHRAQRTDLHETTVQSFLAQLQPKDWNLPPELWERHEHRCFNDRWNLARYFQWPPDLFAATSLLLENTGAYRAAVASGSDGAYWPRAGWPATCRRVAVAWRKHLALSLRPQVQNRLHRVHSASAPMDQPSGVAVPLRPYFQELYRLRNVCVNDLYDVGDQRAERPRDKDAIDLTRTLLDLHSIADETMCGIGTLFAPSIPRDDSPPPCAGLELLHLNANVLLTMRGTLSRIGKHRGLVLPKLQTPELGLTSRSLSHYLSFHQAEVDIAWRAVPWPNIEEHTLNILVFPWPFELQASAFRALHQATYERLGESTVYFAYTPRADFDSKRVVHAVMSAHEEVKRVHMVVLPEAALTEKQLKALKNSLQQLSAGRVPAIVTGVADAPANRPKERYNRAVLSIYHAGKWYDMRQDKHHRWRLDPNQIASYQLTGALSGSRHAWEAISIPRRRLSFLTSSAWLTIAPLICEDLARLDPVSSIVRGVGPTLVVALLLDGPQLKDRWPARYASVLADDPGSSVLTVTALGLSRRSLPYPREHMDACKERDANAACVSLWKDRINGNRVLRVDDVDKLALLLSVATQERLEETVDTRKTTGSGVLSYQTMRRLATVEKEEIPRSTDTPAEEQRAEAGESPASADAAGTTADEQAGDLEHIDVLELSLFTFFLEALVDAPKSERGDIVSWMKRSVGAESDDTVFGLQTGSGFVKGNKHPGVGWEVLRLIRWCISNRRSVPKRLPTPQLMMAIDFASSIIVSENSGGKLLEDIVLEAERSTQQVYDEAKNKEQRDHFLKSANQILKERSEVAGSELWTQEEFRASSFLRIRPAVSSAILACVHNRLLTARRAGAYSLTSPMLLGRVEALLDRASSWPAMMAWQKQRANEDSEKLQDQ